MPFRPFRNPHRHLYLFLHIPKCAGTTLTESLGGLGKKRFMVISEHPPTKAAALDLATTRMREQETTADRLDVIAGHDVFIGMHEISTRPPYYFTVLRHPVERYVSHYKYLVDVACKRADAKPEFARKTRNLLLENGQPISLEEFARRRLKTNVMTQYLAAASHPEHQTGWRVISDPDELFDHAEKSLHLLQWIGLVEEFPDDLQVICRKLKVKPAAAVNRSMTVVPEVTPRVEALVRENNSLDCRIYDQAVELRRKLNLQPDSIR